MGMTGRLLTHTVGDGRLTRYGVRFTAQVWPGDDLSASATVTAIDRVEGAPIAEFSLETKNQDGVVVLSGSAAARMDTFQPFPGYHAVPKSRKLKNWVRTGG